MLGDLEVLVSFWRMQVEVIYSSDDEIWARRFSHEGEVLCLDGQAVSE